VGGVIASQMDNGLGVSDLIDRHDRDDLRRRSLCPGSQDGSTNSAEAIDSNSITHDGGVNSGAGDAGMCLSIQQDVLHGRHHIVDGKAELLHQ